ncbi:aldehyde dehydrogenase family protein [Pusillimonas sp.]|uniref:aldehyde dehydrogenase family protein n=1 Tax=Pusillimonas sp. TaxID=3040095 RepID=UPI0037C69012
MPKADLRERYVGMSLEAVLPSRRRLYYGGDWHDGERGEMALASPSDGRGLGHVALAGVGDVDAAVNAAHAGFSVWKDVPPFERGRVLREAARILRDNALELAMIDAADCGNPVSAMVGDVELAASGLEYFSGLVQETKGDTIPMGPGRINMTVREPLGVCLRIIPYNHPLMFAAMRAAAPLAAGNALVIKAPDQAPLSCLKLAELWHGLLPAGVFNIMTGGPEVGAALVGHPLISKVGLVGSVQTGRKVMETASKRLTPVGLELGGKNALMAWPDVDADKVAQAAIAGMNFTWAGQSCGSTSRVFLHERIHDEVIQRMSRLVEGTAPGLSLDWDTRMGALISRPHLDAVAGFVTEAVGEGAEVIAGGRIPDDEALAGGYFYLPTILANVHSKMRVAREEVFGPVMSVLSWSDEEDLFRAVNGVEYGLTASIWSNDLKTAMRASQRVDAGYVWINDVSRHFLGAPFGGFKQSGFGKEESLEELLEHTRLKNVNINLA